MYNVLSLQPLRFYSLTQPGLQIYIASKCVGCNAYIFSKHCNNTKPRGRVPSPRRSEGYGQTIFLNGIVWSTIPFSLSSSPPLCSSLLPRTDEDAKWSENFHLNIRPTTDQPTNQPASQLANQPASQMFSPNITGGNTKRARL